MSCVRAAVNLNGKLLMCGMQSMSWEVTSLKGTPKDSFRRPRLVFTGPSTLCQTLFRRLFWESLSVKFEIEDCALLLASACSFSAKTLNSRTGTGSGRDISSGWAQASRQECFDQVESSPAVIIHPSNSSSRSVFSSSWSHVLKNNQSLNSFARSKGQTKVSTWMAWSFHSDQFNIHQCGCSRDAQGGVHLFPLADMTFGFPVGLLAMPKKLARRSWITFQYSPYDLRCRRISVNI